MLFGNRCARLRSDDRTRCFRCFIHHAPTAARQGNAEATRKGKHERRFRSANPQTCVDTAIGQRSIGWRQGSLQIRPPDFTRPQRVKKQRPYFLVGGIGGILPILGPLVKRERVIHLPNLKKRSANQSATDLQLRFRMF